jgi:hypothetical protein
MLKKFSLWLAKRSLARANRRALDEEVRNFNRILAVMPGRYGPEKMQLAFNASFCDKMAMKCRSLASELYLGGEYTVHGALAEAERQIASTIRTVCDYEVAKMFRHLWKTMTIDEKLTPPARQKMTDDCAALMKKFEASALQRQIKREQDRRLN